MKSVVICGSRRFKKEVRRFARELENSGVTVFVPYHHSGEKEWEGMSVSYKNFVALGLTHDHFYKIRMADIVYIYNKKGYVGNSTTLEIGYAVALGKTIYAFSDKDDERCRAVLIRKVVKQPKELVKLLK